MCYAPAAIRVPLPLIYWKECESGRFRRSITPVTPEGRTPPTRPPFKSSPKVQSDEKRQKLFELMRDASRDSCKFP
jgi:hypothetical protein